MQDFNYAPPVIDTAISDKYDPTATYAVGDLVIHEDRLYKCTTAISTAETWTAAHWTETSIDTEIGSVRSAIPEVVNALNDTSTGKALSAAQGKALKDTTDTLNGSINTTRRDISSSDTIKDCNNAEIGKCYNVYGSALNTPFTTVVSVLFTYGTQVVKSQVITNGRRMFIRSFTNNSWSTWEELALNDNIGSDGTKIKHGRQTMRVNQSASGYEPATASIIFTTPFADANYHVFLTNTNGGGGDWNQIMISSSSLTKDGFTITANDNKVGTVTNILLYVDWVAVHN